MKNLVILKTQKLVKNILVGLLCSLAFTALGERAIAQAPIPYQQMLLLIAGPSGDRIDPQEQRVVEHLNGLRSTYNFTELQMGTMHYDRPSEAALLTKTLGFSPQNGITVGLVQLSDQGLPVKTVYKLEQVTQASLLAAQNDLLTRWSRATGQTIPPELMPAGSANRNQPATSTTPTGTTQPTSTTQPASSTQQPWMAPNTGPTKVYSFEEVQSVTKALATRTATVWDNVRNAPLRSDGNDLPVREQTKALYDAAHNLRAAAERGVIYPLNDLAAVSQIGRAWHESDPQYYLPVPLRSEVEPILDLLRQAEEIHTQGSRAALADPKLKP